MYSSDKDYYIRAIHKTETSFLSWDGMENHHTRPIEDSYYIGRRYT